MACNRETSADGTTSSTASGCQNPDALVPCCNSNCCFLGCAATMNLCSKCYSEHLVEEGALNFTSKQRVDPCEPTMDTLAVRSMVCAVAEGAGETHESHITDDEAAKRSEDAASLGRIAVDASADMMDLREALRSKNTSSMCSNAADVSDVRGMLRPIDVSAVVVNTMAVVSDSCHQRIPSPLTLSPVELAPRQIETVLPRPPLPRQQAVNRCLACRKRVGLLGFKCRCGNLFCALHRYSDKHDCSFDYKAAGRITIAKENPVVVASKVVKI